MIVNHQWHIASKVARQSKRPWCPWYRLCAPRCTCFCQGIALYSRERRREQDQSVDSQGSRIPLRGRDDDSTCHIFAHPGYAAIDIAGAIQKLGTADAQYSQNYYNRFCWCTKLQNESKCPDILNLKVPDLKSGWQRVLYFWCLPLSTPWFFQERCGRTSSSGTCSSTWSGDGCVTQRHSIYAPMISPSINFIVRHKWW